MQTKLVDITGLQQAIELLKSSGDVLVDNKVLSIKNELTPKILNNEISILEIKDKIALLLQSKELGIEDYVGVKNQIFSNNDIILTKSEIPLNGTVKILATIINSDICIEAYDTNNLRITNLEYTVIGGIPGGTYTFNYKQFPSDFNYLKLKSVSTVFIKIYIEEYSNKSLYNRIKNIENTGGIDITALENKIKELSGLTIKTPESEQYIEINKIDDQVIISSTEIINTTVNDVLDLKKDMSEVLFATINDINYT